MNVCFGAIFKEAYFKKSVVLVKMDLTPIIN